MIYIDADHLSDGLYNVKDGKIYKYKAKGGTVRTYDIRNIVRCKDCKYWRAYETWSECVLWAGDPYETAKTNADDFCSYGSRSEKPNNCEHITEDGVTCAKYPACDDCLDNPLNKVKGSERLVKGSERSSK